MPRDGGILRRANTAVRGVAPAAAPVARLRPMGPSPVPVRRGTVTETQRTVVEEAELCERAARGDAASLDALLARHLPQLHAYVRARLSRDVRARESSMDVVQSVCGDLLAERGCFDFRGDDRFRAWLFTAALNKIRDKYRFHRGAGRDVRRERHARELELELAAPDLWSPSQDAIAAETTRHVHDALAELEADHREVITLARMLGMPHRVVAEVMARSEDATRQLLGRAMVQLALVLKRHGIAAG